MSISSKYAYQTRYLNSLPPKQNAIPLYLRMSNSSAEVVLRERKVEIKDLESRITYLQNQIKDLKIENKTLKDVQSRHEKELRKFKEGVADIPSLMRSHKEEIKALESNISSQRRELRECQKELKSKCDIILRKDQQFEKINSISKRNEKHVQELNIENKELKSEKKKLDEECKKLLNGNEELKSKNERLQKKVQQMSNRILDLEESLGSAEHQKTQLKEDMAKLQKNFEELQQNFALLKCHPPVISSETQTESSINLTNSTFEDPSTSCQNENEINVGALLYAEKDNTIKKNCIGNNGGTIKNQSTTPKCENTNDIFGMHSPLSFRTEAKEQKFLLEPLKPRLPFTTKVLEHTNTLSVETPNDEKSKFSFRSPYSSSNIFESQCSLKNTELRNSNEDKFCKKDAVKNTCEVFDIVQF